MNRRERNQQALRQAFEKTLEGRGEFERLDLRSTRAVIDMLDRAVGLARRHPREFFAGFAAPAAHDDGETFGGGQETSTRIRPPVAQIENMLDFLKSQKEYWGGRDDTAQESVTPRATGRGSGKRPDSDLWDVIVELDPPPRRDDSVEAFDLRTGEKLGDMKRGWGPGAYIGPESGVAEGQRVQVRLNGVPVAVIQAGGP